MSRVSVQGIFGYSSPSDRALVRDAGGQPRCDPAKIPKEIACVYRAWYERSSSFQAFAMLASRDDGQPPSSLCMLVGRSIVPTPHHLSAIFVRALTLAHMGARRPQGLRKRAF